MDLLQAQAEALATRYQILRNVRDARKPATVAELTELTGLNHNAVRQHLAKLVSAGLVEERSHPTGRRRRPFSNTAPRPAAPAPPGGPNPYEGLAGLLGEMRRCDLEPAEAGLRAGERAAAAAVLQCAASGSSDNTNGVRGSHGGPHK